MDIQQWFYSLPLRLRSFFHPNKVDQELQEELREHLEQQIKENVARGMSPEEARSSAVRTLGGITQIEQQCRDARGGSVLADFVQDLRYGFRQLCRSHCPTHSSIRFATGAAHRIAQIGTFFTAASAKCIPASESTHQANRRRHAFHNPAAAHTGNSSSNQ